MTSRATVSIQLTPDQVKYLAELVDQDTTGRQDDDLYLLLMTAYNAYDEEENDES